MEELLSILPCADIRALTMGPEFVVGGWLSWLKLIGIPFAVRVKANTMVGGSPASWWCERNRWKRFAGDLHEVFDLLQPSEVSREHLRRMAPVA